ncbi:Tn3 family transposase [Streptomyces mirabilis]|uniref:Tn3 family transposase n=1 Tax=Streptomyces mirabilis TaxID=68239 RepID=UPI0033C76D62
MVENWNSSNHDLFYGKDGDLTGSDKESQEVSMLALHLLQSALVHVNTLLPAGHPGRGEVAGAAHRRRPAGPVSAVLDPREPLWPVRARHELHLDLAIAAAMVPGPRTRPETQAPDPAAEGTTGSRT